MSSIDKILAADLSSLPDGKYFKVGIVCSEWNIDITTPMCKGAIETLQKAGVDINNIFICYVPGAFELPLAAQKIAKHSEIDGVICIGCVIRGETTHYDYICNSSAMGIMQVGLNLNKPVIFGVLTTENKQQAIDRAGGKYGNKGEEAAYSLLKMLA